MRGELCLLLAEDADLGSDLDPARRAVGAERLLARIVRVDASDHNALTRADATVPARQRGMGLLVIDGLMLRRIGSTGARGAELLGAGDLLRPFQGADLDPAAAHDATWEVLRPSRLAVLDLEFVKRASDYPEVLGALAGRALARSRQLAATMAIVQTRSLDLRLQMLFWLLAARWGTVAPSGVELALPLSHSQLAQMVAARRPSVTTALGRLNAAGHVRALDGRWLLTGEPPVLLAELGMAIERRP